MAANDQTPRPPARLRWLVLALGVCLAAGSCSRFKSCNVDEVRADVLHYKKQLSRLDAERKQLKARIREFDGKIFTNQRAGVDLLEAVLTRATLAFAAKLRDLKVRSHLIRPHHKKKVAAYERLAAAYEVLMRAYPKADFDSIRAGLKVREQAMRDLEAAELRLARLIRRYQRRKR